MPVTMDELAREHLRDFYATQFMMFGDRPEAVRWSPEGQQGRFNALLSVVPSPSALNGSSILDYGCGKADFLPHLRSLGVECAYTGYDITPEFIELARAKYPHARFQVRDAEESGVDGEFDYAFACGVFSKRVQGATMSLKNTMRILFEHTRRAVAFTCLSSLERFPSVELNYVDPDDLIEYCEQHITPHAVLRRDLVPGANIVFLYHTQPTEALHP
jgi:SAM-dependent methyltransferase